MKKVQSKAYTRLSKDSGVNKSSIHSFFNTVGLPLKNIYLNKIQSTVIFLKKFSELQSSGISRLFKFGICKVVLDENTMLQLSKEFKSSKEMLFLSSESSTAVYVKIY